MSPEERTHLMRSLLSNIQTVFGLNRKPVYLFSISGALIQKVEEITKDDLLIFACFYLTSIHAIVSLYLLRSAFDKAHFGHKDI